MIIKRIISVLFIVLTILCCNSLFLDRLYSEENIITLPVFPEDLTNVDAESDLNAEQNNNSKNINLDAQGLYGLQYNQMFAGFSLSQEKDAFVYLVSSKFNRSGDFGYNDKLYVNSGFYENTVGLTVNYNWTDAKIIIDGEVDNESRGMFNNEKYSREEKGNNKISSKTIFKISPSTELFFSAGGAWYKHSLVAIAPADFTKSRVLQGNFKSGIEYVWSASNRMRLNADYLYYDYEPSSDQNNDWHAKGEIIDDFNMSRNVGISLGVGYVNNKDEKNMEFPVPISASLSLKEYKYFSAVIMYKYDLIPFQPEEFYLKQKYINPNYDLPPGTVHDGEIKTDFKVNSIVNIKANFKVEKNNNYYNYLTAPTGNVLMAETIDAVLYNPGVEANFSFYNKIWDIAITYNYYYFDSQKNITYMPDHEASGAIQYNGKNWKFDWTNTFRGKVYVDPDSDETLPSAIIGSLGIQRKMLEGSYFYCKIENLYNNKYTLRNGYPEPGISFLIGLRILI